LVESFLNWLTSEKKYSQHTIKSYKTDLESFKGYLSEDYSGLPLIEASKVQIKSWVMTLLNSGYSAVTVNRKLVALSTFYKYAIREGCLDVNPVDLVSRPKKPKRLAKFIDESTTSKIFDVSQFDGDFDGQRSRLIMELLYSTGIRVSELLGIAHGDVDEKRAELKVLGKGNKERHIPISRSLISLIGSFSALKTSEGFTTGALDFLLVTDKGKQLYPVFVARKVKAVLQAYANISGTNPHILRHTFATHLLNNGSDITSIKELMGHSSLASTTVYTHNSIDRLKDVYKHSHPRK